MTADRTTSVAWMAEGTRLMTDDIVALDERGYDRPSGLPGWSRRHLVAHVASNAEALGRLLTWALTGQPRPMYASSEQRAADIETGALLDAARLTEWFIRSADDLAHAVGELPTDAWDAKVTTAMGRTVPASDIPWMRSREVMVHAVDLVASTTFAELPGDFLAALRGDIVERRGSALPLDADGDPDQVTAWLAGRPHVGVTINGHPAPDLPAWL